VFPPIVDGIIYIREVGAELVFIGLVVIDYPIRRCRQMHLEDMPLCKLMPELVKSQKEWWEMLRQHILRWNLPFSRIVVESNFMAMLDGIPPVPPTASGPYPSPPVP